MVECRGQMYVRESEGQRVRIQISIHPQRGRPSISVTASESIRDDGRVCGWKTKMEEKTTTNISNTALETTSLEIPGHYNNPRRFSSFTMPA